MRDEQTEDDAALAAVTAAVVGVILNLTVWFALNVLFSEHTTIWYGLLRLNVPNPSSLDPVALVLSASAGICWRDDGATGQVPASGSHG